MFQVERKYKSMDKYGMNRWTEGKMDGLISQSRTQITHMVVFIEKVNKKYHHDFS